MPGWSLWLVPPESSSLHTALTTLITTTLPSLFPDTDHPAFHPHITLTADIPPSTFAEADPQVWLDGLALPEGGGSGIDVVVGGVEVGESFVKKLTLKVEEGNGGLVELAVWCRAGAVFGGDFEGARSSTTPPSTLTAALSTKILPAVSTAKQAATSTAATSTADQPPDTQSDAPNDQNPQQRERERQERNSWRGTSSVWLVPTALPVGEWTAVARREIGGLVWVWE
ncbi:hypothetical protein LTR50_000073 [Elasticomyces elasticus]|nr:hypothetical protein LTR50_000073 [Elasticomyces elasticus]